MEATTVKMSKQSVARLRDIIKVNGTSDTLGTAIEKLIDKEMTNYGHTHKGLVKVGDNIAIVKRGTGLTGETRTIMDIQNGEAILDDYSVLTTSLLYWCEPSNA